jgi:hypothetical protein
MSRVGQFLRPFFREIMMKRSVAVASALCAALLFVAGPVQAAPTAHFLKASASGPDAAGNLAVDFTLAGARGTVTVTATANATALYTCFGSLDHVHGIVSTSGDFTASRNKIIAALALNPPAPTVCTAADASLIQVSYSNVAVSGGGDTLAIPGVFERSF